MRAVGALVVSIVVASGCGTATSGSRPRPTPAHPGTITVGLDWNGDHRFFLLHRPSHLATGAVAPVVVVLHGASLTAEQTERYYHWDDLADEKGFVVAYPQGIGKAWNAGSCCGGAPSRGTDDVGFVNAVLDNVVRIGPGDPARLYLTGVSNGAMLTLRYACERPGRLAAIGSVAGTFTAPCGHPPRIAFIAIHGLSDQAVPYQSEGEMAGAGPGALLPAAEAIQRMREADGCHDPVVVTVGPVHTETDRCAPGADVEVITIDGAGHQWPGAVLDAARAAYDGPRDQPDTHVDATHELWSFFASHRLVGGGGGT